MLLQITYQKKLGLPNYSSHSVSVSVQVEVPDVNLVAEENARLYQLLQASVDKEIQVVGYLPDATKYSVNGESNGHQNGNGHHRQNGGGDSGISEKQIDLINGIIKENNVSKTEVDGMAVEMFGGGVRTLNRDAGQQYHRRAVREVPASECGSRGKYQQRERTRT